MIKFSWIVATINNLTRDDCIKFEAYAAKGEVKGGITIFGIKIDAAVEGKAGAIGAKAGINI